MLLLHGLAENDSVWDRCVEGLEEYEVWSARLPWRSERTNEWARERDLAVPLAEALEAVPGGPQVVVAHSMSSNLLLDLFDRESRAGRDPFARFGVRAVVLVSPFYRRTAEEFVWENLSSSLDGFLLIMEEGIRVHSAGRLPSEIQLAMAQRVRDRVGPHGWLRFFESYLRTPELEPVRMTVPCLVLGGENDIAAVPAESETLAADLPDARVRILPGCGHFPMIEEAERFASEIRAFVNSHTTEAPQCGPAAHTVLEHRR
ncbi:alpha/beta fold hydrolase [Streptomyces sp. M2CJ-2]|uniref:alpha/beta fold hydrolase n=1 Tax=Streptomyces sp. M2CJ-2 TaxID=2803948 RepID=UPI001F423AA2|nr:alpha/beta hydrolase [Streptomyces sp. M2CJ-2]